jgi:hypothetical protein
MGSVIFNEVQDHTWLFEFIEEVDKERVIEGRPWPFDKQILVLNEFGGHCPP